MGSSFDVGLTKLDLMKLDFTRVDLTRISDVVSRFAKDHVLLSLTLVGAILVWSYYSTYSQRRTKERRLTGREGALEALATMRLPRKRRAHEMNPARR